VGRGKKVLNLVLDSFGSFLGMEKGCIVLRDREGNTQKYPLVESKIGEVVLKSGNMVSTGVLTSLAYWGIDVVVATKNGRPIAVLKNLNDDSHVKTRICQYEALKNGKGIHVAKQIVLAKVLGQNQVLRKYGLRQLDVLRIKERIENIEAVDSSSLRKKLTGIEGKASEYYFEHIFRLFDKRLRPEQRYAFHAYDGMNNLLNLAYELLFMKCFKALSKAHLESHLGFVHSLALGKPSLVCDFQELYRYLVDDFLIGYRLNLRSKDFNPKTVMLNDKRGKRVFLSKSKTRELTREFHDYFRRMVDIPRVKHGNRQEIESLINEEALLLAKYLRNERKDWTPRIVEL
jgi:CRISPR-associated protein Cas1